MGGNLRKRRDQSKAIGTEGCGIVRNIGPDVQRVKVGDRIMFLSDGSFSTSIVLSDHLCAKVGDGVDFSEVASMPLAFSTAIYALIDRCHLQRGQVSEAGAKREAGLMHTNLVVQSILIHAATGGVGLAAVQLCQMIVAKVKTVAR